MRISSFRDQGVEFWSGVQRLGSVFGVSGLQALGFRHEGSGLRV